MKDLLIKWFMTFNSFLIRISGGKLGSKLGSQTVLILHTVGRKSVKPRSVPIAYFDYKDKYLLVGSNWGRDKQADWFVNLKKEPRATIAAANLSTNESNIFRVMFFLLTFFTIGMVSNFKKLWEEGIGKLAAVYVLCLFGFIIWVGLIISWIFFHGVKPPIITG